MILRPLSAVLLLCAAARAGNSTDYTLEPLANGTGGRSATSTDYSLVGSTTPGGHGSSGAYTARTGFAGQLAAPFGMILSSPASAIAENSTVQLAADLLYDDGARQSLPSSTVTWSVLSGPVEGLSPDGLATAAAVYQDALASVRGSIGTYSADLALTVLDSLPDNFSTYAADGLPDAWQIQYFGIDAPDAGKFDDFDGDTVGNLIEFANGTNPSSPSSGPQALVFLNDTLVSPGQPVVDYSPAPRVLPYRVLFVRRKNASAFLNYDPQFSNQLSNWANATTPLTVLSDNGTFELVSIRFPVLIGGVRSNSKFFRLNPMTPP